METELPSLAMLVAVELAVVGLTAVATWRYALYRFRRRRQAARGEPASAKRIEQLEEALDTVAREVDRLGEGQEFVTELLTKKLRQIRESGRVSSGDAP